MTKVLVTGSAGFIGFHLCSRLLKDGFEVVGVDSLNEYYDVALKKSRTALLTHPNFRFYKIDIADRKSTEGLFFYGFD